MFKKVFAVFAAVLAAVVGLTACKPKENPYEGKTLIRMGVYDGGNGVEWMQEVADEFEKMYPEYKVLIDPDKNKYQYGTLLSSIDAYPQDMFCAPLYLYDNISQGKMMDITDVMTTPLNEQLPGITETATIQSKMWDDLDEFYSGYRGEGKYYGIPYGGNLYALNYDRDLFDEKKFFIKEGTSAPNIEWVGESGPLSVGQDGKAGTYDDGLPVTYADFMALLEEMKAQNVVPFMYSSVTGYLGQFLYSAFASFEGKKNFDLLKTMDGTYTFNNGNTLEITPQNAYMVQQFDGREAVVKFAYDIVKGGYIHDQAGTASMGFREAQDTYLMSVDLAKKGRGKRIAFFIDGGYWLYEASDTVRAMSEMSSEYENRRFGIMPFPKFEGAHAEKTTYYLSGVYAGMFIKSSAKEVEGCKKFLAFMHTDESLRTCTRVCGMRRSLNYELTEEDLAAMDYFYASQYNVYKDADLVYHTCNNPRIYMNEQFFENGGWKAPQVNTASGQSYDDPISAFRQNAGLTVQDYLDAIKNTYTQQQWLGVIGE